MVPVVRPFGGFDIAQDISIGLFPPQNPCVFVTVRERGFPSRGDILDIHCCFFPFIFNLDFGKEFTQIIIG